MATQINCKQFSESLVVSLLGLESIPWPLDGHLLTDRNSDRPREVSIGPQWWGQTNIDLPYGVDNSDRPCDVDNSDQPRGVERQVVTELLMLVFSIKHVIMYVVQSLNVDLRTVIK